MKICFATEVTYPNYVNRIKKSSLNCFIEKKLHELGVYYYISTNLPDDFVEYKDNDYIKVFSIDELRINNVESQEYELFPEDPTGLYPSRYPWNSRRFVIEQAAKDGFNYVIYIDADTVFRNDLSQIDFYNQIVSSYEPNTVKTNSTIFKYKNRTPEDVFNFHDLYINHFNLNFKEDDYDTIDGPCQVFIGDTNEDILRLTSNWNKFTIFGYKKEFGYGYGNNKHGNLSFVIPLSNFKLKWQGYPFYPNHIATDRYTYENKFINEDDKPKKESNVEKKDNYNLSQIFSKYSCDKVDSNYTEVYNFLLNPLKDEKIKLLEIGIGTVSRTPLEGMGCVPSSMYGWKENNQNYKPGASLRGWRDFFHNGEIYGIDIQPDCLIEEERIKTFIFDSTNKEITNQYFDDESLDIIIDDGDHDPNFQIKTFINFYRKLKNDGLYIIEGVVDSKTVCDYLKDNNIEHVYHDLRMITIKKNGTINFTKNKVLKENKKSEITELKSTFEPINFINEDKEFKINGVKLADNGFFINLNKSTDRLYNVVKQIEKFKIEGLQRFEALTDEWRQYSCTKSHLAVLEEFANSNHETAFIAEDDFQIEDTCYYPINENKNILLDEVVNNVYEDLNKIEWDVVLLGCNPKSNIIPITKNIGIIDRSTGAWAYLIKKNAAKFILENLNYRKQLLAIDDFLPRLNDKGLKTLTTIPLLINHAEGYESTLQPAGPTYYDGWIKGNYHKFLYDNLKNEKSDITKIQQNTTIFITGHFCDNFLFYLNYLIYSLPEELKKCRFIIRYDNHENLPNVETQLKHYFYNQQSNLNVRISTGKGGLISSIKYGLENIQTKYFIHLEHDWVFLKKNSVNFTNLIGALENNEFVNAVWFNKDDNQMRGFEICRDKLDRTTPFDVDKRIKEANLISSVRWSNNPAIYRKEKYIEWFNKYINNEFVDIQNQGPHNVEEKMIPIYRDIVSKNLWEEVRDDWGTFIYGEIGDDPIVGHTDASNRYKGQMRSQPEINGEEYIKNNPITIE